MNAFFAVFSQHYTSDRKYHFSAIASPLSRVCFLSCVLLVACSNGTGTVPGSQNPAGTGVVAGGPGVLPGTAGTVAAAAGATASATAGTSAPATAGSSSGGSAGQAAGASGSAAGSGASAGAGAGSPAAGGPAQGTAGTGATAGAGSPMPSAAEAKGCGDTKLLAAPDDPGATGPWAVGVKTAMIMTSGGPETVEI
ncbi:MAG TPA: hypothetical protein VFG30_26400, partial [Polyangiales bacterium]|nr:hypothetical protein [Polyangiales bacterium]